MNRFGHSNIKILTVEISTGLNESAEFQTKLDIIIIIEILPLVIPHTQKWLYTLTYKRNACSKHIQEIWCMHKILAAITYIQQMSSWGISEPS